MSFTRNSNTRWRLMLVTILGVNFSLRLLILYSTNLFSFSDYSVYLGAVDKIWSNEEVYLLNGNFLYAISYIGYFAKYLLGNLNYFFIFNCLLGTGVSFIMYYLVVAISGSKPAGLLTILLHTLYTEFLVFSSVFYTPVIMIFLLSVFLVILYKFYREDQKHIQLVYIIILIIIFLGSFYFKPELKYLPLFLFVYSLFWLKKDKLFVKRNIILAFSLLFAGLIFNWAGLITKPAGNVLANDFIFFGHTDYGGDGGEGSFIYPENRARYESALTQYCNERNIVNPDRKQLNQFHRNEIGRFVTMHPLKWINLQLIKFFRTFGVVPESTSFKILYAGLFKGKLWLTSIIAVAPVALIILLFIQLCNIQTINKLFFSANKDKNLEPGTWNLGRKYFGYIYFMLFFYYIIATCFFGQYQERYRMPVMVVFIIPMLGYFIATFNRKQFLNRTSLGIKSAVIALFLTVWVFQANKAIHNKQRLENAIESVSGVDGNQ